MRIALFIYLFIFLNQNVNAFTILIDPGHGGDDTGAKGIIAKETIWEKDLALQISNKVFKKLRNKYSVYLTRSLDRTVTLQERADLAEKIKADIFVSIHLNSNPAVQSNGVEVFYLDNHNDVAVKKVENVENKIFEKESPGVQHILTDLVIQQTVSQSKQLANIIHQEIKKGVAHKFSMKDRGIAPGLFYVLALSKRPSVLLEVGFISNVNELKKMMSEPFQEKMAESITNGISKYIQKNQPKKIPLF